MVYKTLSTYINTNKYIYENYNNKKKFILIQEYFQSKNKERYQEIMLTLQKNLQNKNIDEIYLLNEKNYKEIEELCKKYSKLKQIIINKRLTFSEAFKFGNKFHENIIIISNNDIEIDENKKTFLNIEKCLQNKNIFLAITRNFWKDNKLHIDTKFSQDTWIYKSPIIIPKESDFFFGLLGCDNRIAKLMSENYEVKNYPKDILTIHNHKSNHRTYTQSSRIKGSYYIPEFSYL